MLNKYFKGVDITYFLLFFVCVTSIFLYGRYRCNNNIKYKDPLTSNLINKTDLTGWSFTHLFFYMLIGYLYPNTLILTMCLGSLWELFEFYVGYYKPSYLKGWGFCFTYKANSIWWYGKWSDLIINFIGFVIGMYIYKTIPK